MDPTLLCRRFPQHRFLSFSLQFPSPKITRVVIYATLGVCNIWIQRNVIPSIAALVSVLPELVAESDPREALKQVPLFLHLYVYALAKKK